MNPFLSLSTVSVMMLGSIEYIDTWVSPLVHDDSSAVEADTLQSTPLSYIMLAIFILLMPILLMNLLVSKQLTENLHALDIVTIRPIMTV